MKTFQVAQPVAVARREVTITHYPVYDAGKPMTDVTVSVWGVARGVGKVRDSEYENVSPKNLRLILFALQSLATELGANVQGSVSINAYSGPATKSLTCYSVEWNINQPKEV